MRFSGFKSGFSLQTAFIGGVTLIALFLVWLWFQGETIAPWAPQNLPELPATGDLPALSVAMDQNPDLKNRVTRLHGYDDAFIFVNYKQVNEDVAAILLLWAGVDIHQRQKTREGIDVRIDGFIRAVHGIPPEDFIRGDPLVGDNPWPRWFSYFKARLLVQGAAQRIYKTPPLYDQRSGNITVQAGLSAPFMRGFLSFLETQPQPGPFINNFLVFVDETKGLSDLSAEDREWIGAMRSYKNTSP